ncbi:MAG: ABC transporter permease [Clostridium sp.]
MSFIISVLEQGLIYGVVSLGVYITYKILDFPDLSVDGSFPLGAGLTALCLTLGINPYLSMLLAFIAGALGGLLTAILHVKFKISNLLSGILVMLALYSITLRVMGGKPNISLYNEKTVFVDGTSKLFVIVIIVIICKILLDLFLKTKLGFMLISSGDNPQLVTSLGVNKGFVITIGLMISNGLVALGGSLIAQQNGFADSAMGVGTIVIGLASIILGTSLFKKARFISVTTITIIGAILYKLVIGAAMVYSDPSDLKLITATIVVIALAFNNVKFKKTKISNIQTNIENVGGDSSASVSESA